MSELIVRVRSGDTENVFQLLRVDESMWMVECDVQVPFNFDMEISQRLAKILGGEYEVHLFCRRKGDGNNTVYMGTLTTARTMISTTAVFIMPPPRFAVQIIAVITTTKTRVMNLPDIPTCHKKYIAAYEKHCTAIRKMNMRTHHSLLEEKVCS